MSVRGLPSGVRYREGRYELYSLCKQCRRARWISSSRSRCEHCRARKARNARLRGLVSLTTLTLLAGSLGLVWATERPVLSFVSYLVGVAALYGVFRLID